MKERSNNIFNLILRKKSIAVILIYLVLIIYAAIALFPLYWVFATSLKPALELMTLEPQWIFEPTLEYYYKILYKDTFPKHLLNSAIISLSTVIGVLIIGNIAGYSLARFKIRHKEDFFFFALTTRMAPPVAFVVPLYLLMFRLNLIDTRFGLTLVYMFMNIAFCIWMSRGFFEEIPVEVEEAALVDGCSRMQTFLRITLPLASGGIIATAVLIFIFTWNEFFFASVLTRSIAKTFTVHLTSYFGARRILWGELSAASSIGAIVPIIFAIVTRRYLVRGMTLGAIK